MSIPPGTQVGRYEIRSLLGAGGMGEVYLAQDSQLDRPVALKIPSAEIVGDPQRLTRFLREARAASKISGAHAAHIYEIDEAATPPFIAMEYVEGEQLAQRIAARRHTPAEIADLGAQIALALEEAHSRGVTHRDIKPQNVIVTARGQAKVLDFGLAKLTDEAGSEASTRVKTNPGAVMGTVSYMSPEQALGRDDVDGRSDIFSLGVVLYEMATGRVPFDGSSVTEIIDRIVHAQPEPIARLNYDVPAELEMVIRKALRKNRDERYQTARDMVNDLRALAGELKFETSSDAHAPAAAAPGTGSSAEYIVQGIRQHKMAAVRALLLFAAIVGAGYGIYRYVAGNAPARFETVRLTRITTEGNLQNVAVSPDGKYISYTLLEAGKRSLWTKHLATGSRVQIVASADAALIAPYGFSHDGSYVFYGQADERHPSGALLRVPVLGGAPKILLTDFASPIGLSPDGTQFAFARYRPSAPSEQYQVWVANIDGTNERRLRAISEPEWLGQNGVSWSPDGKLLAVDYGSGEGGDHMTVAAIVVADGSFKRLSPHRWGSVGRIAWFDDGTGMAVVAREFGAQNWQIWRVSHPAGEARRVTNDLHSYYLASLTLTADSRTLVALQVDETSSIWVTSEGETRRARALDVKGGSLDWTPDGRLVFAGNEASGSRISVMNADGSEQKALMDAGSAPQVSADGRHIFFKSQRTNSSQVWRMDSDGSRPTQLTQGNGVESFAVTPDGRWLIYAGYAPGIWKMSTDGGAPVKLIDAAAFELQVSPDGKFVAYAGLDAQTNRLRLTVRTLDGMASVTSVDLPVTASANFRWSADSRAVVYVDTRGDVSNLWRQGLDGGKPTAITEFTSHAIRTFAYSRDGKQLALSRGKVTRDALMIREER